jgi:hypothetical protein
MLLKMHKFDVTVITATDQLWTCNMERCIFS